MKEPEPERILEAMLSAMGARADAEDEEDDVLARRGCVMIWAYVGCAFKKFSA